MNSSSNEEQNIRTANKAAQTLLTQAQWIVLALRDIAQEKNSEIAIKMLTEDGGIEPSNLEYENLLTSVERVAQFFTQTRQSVLTMGGFTSDNAHSLACQYSESVLGARNMVIAVVLTVKKHPLATEWTTAPAHTKIPTLEFVQLAWPELKKRFAGKEFQIDGDKLEAEMRWEVAHAIENLRPRANSPMSGQESNDEIPGIEQLPDSIRLAYLSFKYAETKLQRTLQDQEAFDYLKEQGFDQRDAGELTEYNLPAFDSWSRYLREARQALGEGKYQKRGCRKLGRSIVKASNLEKKEVESD